MQRIDKQARAGFIRHLLNDLQALEKMLEQNQFESGITRIGAEQEFCLLSHNWRPATQWEAVLNSLNDHHFTTELARYNLELNLDPLELKGHCFRQMEETLQGFLKRASQAAAQHEQRILLAGILPTISKRELGLDFMTPLPRYHLLNEMLKTLRGSDFELRIRGIDELCISHDSVLFEACNTSFQMHLQIDPDDFIASYNWSQAIAGPLLSICANSPLLLGRELWAETRIALFQQSLDTRISSYALKEQRPRVSFGHHWAQGSIAEIFKNDIISHKVLLTNPLEDDSLQELAEGKIPRLKALALHSGTVYHWNRPCFGTGGGKAHLRIENRYLPSGPSTIDEMANFAFWVGLMKGRPAQYDQLAQHMDFRDAKANFIKAARTGRESVMHWMGNQYAASELVEKELLPLAAEGLAKAGVDRDDSQRYLDIIAQRCQRQTGAQWMIKNYRQLKQSHKKDDALLMLTKATYNNQQKEIPVHQWPAVDPGLEAHEASTLVKHIMSTQLFTVSDNDLAQLATRMMEWKNIHHIPVENEAKQLCGILTWSHMKNFREQGNETQNCLVNDIMAKPVITVDVDTPIPQAIALMKDKAIGCLPVVHQQHLVGIVTVNDIKAYQYG